MISGVARFLINVEALNGVETVGNLNKHRTATIVLETSSGYMTTYVPAISGATVAHDYQVALVNIADRMKLPLSKTSRQYEFVKFSSEDILKEENITPPKNAKEARRFEVEIMLKDVVADIGGFMYAGKTPVRRTSRIKFGYMIPVAKEDVLASIDAQFHTRSSNTAEEGKQSIYNVEVASALYTLVFQLDEDLISVPSTVGDKVNGEEDLAKQRHDRTEAAIRALYCVLTGNFGGKRSRFLPSLELKSLIVTRTDFPFIPSPANRDDYIEDTIQRLQKAKKILEGNVAEAYVINNENHNIPQGLTMLSSVEELIETLLETL